MAKAYNDKLEDVRYAMIFLSEMFINTIGSEVYFTDDGKNGAGIVLKHFADMVGDVAQEIDGKFMEVKKEVNNEAKRDLERAEED